MKASYASIIRCHLKSKLALLAAGVKSLKRNRTSPCPSACALQMILHFVGPLLSLPYLIINADVNLNRHMMSIFSPRYCDTNLSPMKRGASNSYSSDSGSSAGGE
eukprot:912508-Ditylum_brightwellii.AAC.1